MGGLCRRVGRLDGHCAHEAIAARAVSVFVPTRVAAPLEHHVSAKRLRKELDDHQAEVS